MFVKTLGVLALGLLALGLGALGLVLQGCEDDDDAIGLDGDGTLVDATGDIAAAVTQFRALLGEPNNGATAGEQASGRREINWDGVPQPFTNVDSFPGAFFNVNSTRGIVLTTPGTGFRVSDNDFNDVNPGYDAEFNDFSPVKTFAAVGSNVLDVTFQLAGSTTPALVTGFGVIFSDVDIEGRSTLELFDIENESLGEFEALARSDADGFSFVGVVFDEPIVERVRITSGEAALGAGEEDISSGGGDDLVILDDFLAGEPRAHPHEPTE